MKKLISILLFGLMILGLAACGSNEETSTTETSTTQTETTKVSTTQSSEMDNTESAVNEEASKEQEQNSEQEPEKEQDNVNSESGSHVLVVYFSATGTTKGVAEKIADITEADMYEIKAAQEYTGADLDYGDSNSRCTKEQNDSSVRPEIGSEIISLNGYDTIYIGYPIWWGEEPRIMDTFVESYNFGDITMIPFCTSASSGMGNSGKNLAKNAGSGNWLNGERFSGSVSESELESWINELK